MISALMAGLILIVVFAFSAVSASATSAATTGGNAMTDIFPGVSGGVSDTSGATQSPTTDGNGMTNIPDTSTLPDATDSGTGTAAINDGMADDETTSNVIGVIIAIIIVIAIVLLIIALIPKNRGIK